MYKSERLRTQDDDEVIVRFTEGVIKEMEECIQQRPIPDMGWTLGMNQTSKGIKQLQTTITNVGASRNQKRMLHNLRTDIRQMFKIGKAEMWSELVEKVSGEKDSNRFWRCVKKILGEWSDDGLEPD